jgi:hypothetical protein
MKKSLSKRPKARLQRLQRDPFGRLALALGGYLESIGWRALVVGSPQVRGGEPGVSRIGHFEFVVTFTGGRIQKQTRSA